MAKTRRRTPTKKRVTSKKGKSQRLWKMRGCAKTYKMGGGGCGCGSQFGGKRVRRGGQMLLSPSPFVNPPTLPSHIQTWPGVQGSGTGNWLTKNQLDVDPTIRTAIQERAGSVFPPKIISGGSRKKRGGVFDLVNVGRSIGYGMNSAYSNLVGTASMPVNPLPTQDQFQRY
jgi:hypothetical protein